MANNPEQVSRQVWDELGRIMAGRSTVFQNLQPQIKSDLTRFMADGTITPNVDTIVRQLSRQFGGDPGVMTPSYVRGVVQRSPNQAAPGADTLQSAQRPVTQTPPGEAQPSIVDRYLQQQQSAANMGAMSGGGQRDARMGMPGEITQGGTANAPSQEMMQRTTPIRDNPPLQGVSPTPGTAATSTPNTNPSGAPNLANITSSPGQYSSEQERFLRENPDQAFQEILAKRGFDPLRPGLMGKFLYQSLQPLLSALLPQTGLMNGGTGEQKPGMEGNLMDKIMNAAFTPGQDLFGMASGMASSVLGNPATQGALGDMQDPTQQRDLLMSLLPALYGNRAPLLQQAASDKANRAWGQFERGGFLNDLGGGQPQGMFTDFLNRGGLNQNDPTLRRLFGLGG